MSLQIQLLLERNNSGPEDMEERNYGHKNSK